MLQIAYGWNFKDFELAVLCTENIRGIYILIKNAQDDTTYK